MHNAVQHIAAQIIAAKKDVNERTPHGFAKRLLQEAYESFPRITMNMINYATKTTKERMIKSTISLSTTPTNICPLTGDDSTDTLTHVSSNSEEASANDNTNITKSTTTADEHRCGGRPKVTTDAAAKILEEQVEAAMQEAAETLKKAKSKVGAVKKKVTKGLAG
jgi:hypothetical protein